MSDEARKEIFGEENSPEEEQKEEESTQPEEEEEKVVTYGESSEEPEQEPEEPGEPKESDIANQEKERAKFYQTGYQEATARLKELDPDYQDWNDSWKDEYKSPSRESLSAEKGKETEEKFLGDLTENELKQLFAKEAQEALQNSYKETQKRARLDNEMNVSRKTLTDFVGRFDVTENELSEAGNYAQSLGLDERTNPQAVAKVVIDRIYMSRMSRDMQGGITKAQSDAAERVKQSRQVQQPSPSAMPEKRQLTKEEKLIKDMREAGGSSDFKEQLFG